MSEQQKMYIRRRKAVLETIPTVPYVLTAYESVQLSADMAAPFLQEANFLYLTGITEPGWELIVNGDGSSILVAPNVTEIHRIFDGGISDQEAREVSGVESVVMKEEGDALLGELCRDSPSVGVLGPSRNEEYYSFSLNPAPLKLFEFVKEHVKKVIDIRPTLAKARGIKSQSEIEAIRTAVNATVDAFIEVKQSLQDTQYEYQLQARFDYAFRTNGLSHAYDPIVASGAHACTLHYGKNTDELPKNGLILMDIGARYNDYAADITRTYAVGIPTERQVAVHAAVEKAHHEIIALLKPGLSVKTYHEKVDEIMKEALKGLGLLTKPEDYRTYFPHAISHGLGLDVHDPLGKPEVFEPGMVLTVEPGIYIPEEGIGVRIEDDILITETGHENLSAHLPTSL